MNEYKLLLEGNCSVLKVTGIFVSKTNYLDFPFSLVLVYMQFVVLYERNPLGLVNMDRVIQGILTHFQSWKLCQHNAKLSWDNDLCDMMRLLCEYIHVVYDGLGAGELEVEKTTYLFTSSIFLLHP